jgi:hypothetical protein
LSTTSSVTTSNDRPDSRGRLRAGQSLLGRGNRVGRGSRTPAVGTRADDRTSGLRSGASSRPRRRAGSAARIGPRHGRVELDLRPFGRAGRSPASTARRFSMGRDTPLPPDTMSRSCGTGCTQPGFPSRRSAILRPVRGPGSHAVEYAHPVVHPTPSVRRCTQYLRGAIARCSRQDHRRREAPADPRRPRACDRRWGFTTARSGALDSGVRWPWCTRQFMHSRAIRGAGPRATNECRRSRIRVG